MPTETSDLEAVVSSKEYQAELKSELANEDEKSFIATISTSGLDRDKEVVIPKGLKFDTYMKNPVVFFSHNAWSFPIAKTAWIKTRGSSIIAKAIPAPTTEGKDAFNLISGGFLTGVSIGFDPRPYATENGPPTMDEIKAMPSWREAKWVHRKADLLEWSVVGIPANPEALIQAVQKGLRLSTGITALLDLPETTIKVIERETVARVKERHDPIIRIVVPTVVRVHEKSEELAVGRALKKYLGGELLRRLS